MSEPKRRDKILVVDDSPESLSFICDALEAADITALVATSGEAALTLVEQIMPDLVLMDAAMPGMGGFEATRQLRGNAATSHVPVIFMTGLTETEHVVQGLGAGAVDYIAKPIILDELLARVRVHLANARVAFGAPHSAGCHRTEPAGDRRGRTSPMVNAASRSASVGDFRGRIGRAERVAAHRDRQTGAIAWRDKAGSRRLCIRFRVTARHFPLSQPRRPR